MRAQPRQHEVVFAAMGEDKEERILATRQRISISETRRKPIGRSTNRAAHLVTMGKIQAAIETLPFQVQQLGHFLYHPYGIAAGEATAEDEAKQSALIVNLKAWKAYKFGLGKVSAQPTWPTAPVWPSEPAVPVMVTDSEISTAETI